jgi:diguanylate cyclase (GGDEF)-like protein
VPEPRRPDDRSVLVPSAPVVLSFFGTGAAAVATFVHHWLPLGAVIVFAVIAGAWLPRRALVRVLALLVLAATVAALVVEGVGHPGNAANPLALVKGALPGLLAGGLVIVAGLLPRRLIHPAIRAARRAEQARADGEVLRLIDDARLFRRVGRVGDGEDRALLKDVSEGVAQRDRLYRLLRLVERVVDGTAVVALYAVDDTGAAMNLVEQTARIDAANKDRLVVGGRGVGPAGLVGLCLQRGAPLRVVDTDGSAVRAHRASGPAPRSVLCVPVRGPGSNAPRGVLVVDRVDAVAFTDEDETVVHAFAEEIVDGLATERIVDDLDAERRRVARVWALGRALTGVRRTADVVDTAVAALTELCPGVAILGLRVGEDGDGRPGRARVLAAVGPLEGLRALPTDVAVDPGSFCARAVAERAPLPHTSLDKASPRPVVAFAEPLSGDGIGDLRVVPLFAQGTAQGALVVATPRGEKLRLDVVEAVGAIADVLALSLCSAAAFDDVERQATTDGLTGVANRRTLDRRLDEAVARVRRNGQPLCVLLTDVDHFKSVNDAWGHGTGDDVLKAVARSLEAEARTTDVVGRLGGEEFVVVCEGTDLDGALTAAERMRTAIKALRFATPKGPLSVTSSFGVALLVPGESGHALLARADQQLYRAKQQGRDRVVG